MVVDTSAAHSVGHNAARGTGDACYAVHAALKFEAAAQRSKAAGSGGTGGAGVTRCVERAVSQSVGQAGSQSPVTSICLVSYLLV